MTTLTTYARNGHDFTLHSRVGDVAIFRGRSRTNSSETWEVIRVQRHNGRDIAGRWCEPAEYPPSNEQWGAKGWTCVGLEQALARLSAMIEEVAP